MRLERTIQKVAAAFAEAVEAGRFAEAEGWLAVARLAAERDSRLVAGTMAPALAPEPGPAA